MASAIDAGKASFLCKDEYNSTVQYERLDVVTYNNAAWCAKKNTKGNAPAKGSTFWQLLVEVPVDATAVHTTDIATTTTPGLVQPDGETIEVNSSGVISVPAATVDDIGATKPDNSTLGVTEDGVLSIKAEYTRSILNGVSGKADELYLDEEDVLLQLLADGAVISEVSLEDFKGESYVLTEDDIQEIADIVYNRIGTADETEY